MADPRKERPGAPLRASYEEVGTERLLFDQKNPRLGGEGRRRSQEQIQRYLEGPPHFALDLVGSIVENGFLPYEPLIVRRFGEDFIVIEGNRRLAAVRSILSDGQRKHPQALLDSLRSLPVVVFPGDQGGDSESVLRFLGVKHLFGFRDWPPLSKAMFLDKRVGSQKDVVQVLKELNITRQEAARYLVPYRLTKAARDVFARVDAEDFWSLAESFGRKNIKIYIQLELDRRAMRIKSFDQAKLGHLAHFLYGKNRCVTDTRQLSTLARVLGSPQAAARLEGGASLEDALLYVAPKQETMSQLYRQIEKLFKRVRMLSPGKEDRARLLRLVEDFSGRLRKRD